MLYFVGHLVDKSCLESAGMVDELVRSSVNFGHFVQQRSADHLDTGGPVDLSGCSQSAAGRQAGIAMQMAKTADHLQMAAVWLDPADCSDSTHRPQSAVEDLVEIALP